MLTQIDFIETIVATVLGSAALFTFIQFLITRHDNKHSKMLEVETILKNIVKRLEIDEKDTTRIQMLLLILILPSEEQEIMEVAQHYFKDKHGNWYMSSLFSKWLKERNLQKPIWFDGSNTGGSDK